MTRLRRAAGGIIAPFAIVGRLAIAVLVPETSAEAVVEVGLLMLAAAFLLAGSPPLALGVPGGILVAIGLGFTFRRHG